MAGLDLKTTLDRIVQEASKITGAPHVNIMLLDRDAGMLRFAAGLGAPPPPDLQLALGESLSGTVALTGLPLFVDDVPNDPRSRLHERDCREGIRTYLGIPVKRGGDVLGVLIVSTTEPRVCGDEEMTVLSVFADQAAIAIENSRLHAETARRLRHTESLLAVSHVVASSPGPVQWAPRLAREAARALGADMVGVCVVTGDGAALSPLAGYHVPERLRATFLDHPIPLRGHEFIEEAFARGAVRWTADAPGDDRIDREIIRRCPHRSVLIAPMSIGAERLGAVFAVWWEAAIRPSEDELRLAEAIGLQAAVARSNGRLYQETEHRRRAAENLAEITRSLAEVLDVQTVAQRIVDGVRPLFAATAAVLRLVRADGSLEGLAMCSRVGPGSRLGQTLPAGGGIAGLAVSQGCPVWTSDVLTDPRVVIPERFRDAIRATGIHAVLAVPLRARGRMIGALSLADEAARTFSGAEVGLLQSFAAAAAVALDNARLYAEAEDRRREAEALASLGRAVSESLESAEVARRVVAALAALLHVSGAAVYRVEETSGDLLPLAVIGQGPLPGADRMLCGQGITGLAVAEGRAITTSDLLADERIQFDPALRQTFATATNRAALAIPLTAGGRLTGTMLAMAETGHVFEGPTIRLAQALADHASVALQNARLYAEAESRRRIAEVMSALTRSITASLDLHTILERVARATQELCGCDVARIALWDPDTASMKFRHWPGTWYPDWDRVCIERGKGIGGIVIETGRPFRTDDYLGDPRISKDYVMSVRAEGTRAELVVPIKTSDRLLGLLYASNRGPQRFTDHDESILLRLAEQAAIALANADLFEREQAARGELRALFEDIPVGVFRTFPSGQIVAANPALVRTLGYPDAETLGRVHPREFVVDHKAWRRWRVEIERHGVIKNVEIEMRRRDGSTVWTRQTTHALRDGAGRVVAYEGLLEDISEQKRAETALRETEEQIRHLQKLEAVGRLAGGIAHDFNNLLTVISARSEMLLARLGPGTTLHRDAGIISSTVQRADRLTRQLLAFGRRQLLQPRVLDVSAVVSEMTTLLRHLLGEDIELVFISGSRDLHANVDQNQLEQVIVNLAVNARDAMPIGGKLTLETSLAAVVEAPSAGHQEVKPGAYVVLAVSDTGVGMDDETRQRIFEPFFTTKKAGKGIGLGLATVHGIVKQSGGHILVSSEVGHHTTFKVYLPRVQATAGDAETAPMARSPASGSETILLVEDEDEVRSVAREILEGCGYRVLEAPSPEDALDVARSHSDPIHLLVTDVVMPQMSGGRLAELVSELRPGIRVLYVSGYTDDVIVRHGGVEDGVDLLEKPFSPDSLAARVREVLSRPPAADTSTPSTGSTDPDA